MIKLLKKLSNANGVSGFEDNVREIIFEELDKFVDDIKVDEMGNLIAIKNGKPDGKKIMLAAHMDEIGLMVRYIDDRGFIKFSKIGGINDQMLLDQSVYIPTKNGNITGVIGSKPPHIMKKSENKKILEYDKMFIDIGVTTREEALKMVNIGDPIIIKQEFEALGNSLVKGKALDNRVGCAIIIEVFKKLKSNATIYGVGTVQEEVGLKGAKTSAYSINPDMALAIDVTIAGDHPGNSALSIDLPFSSDQAICHYNLLKSIDPETQANHIYHKLRRIRVFLSVHHPKYGSGLNSCPCENEFQHHIFPEKTEAWHRK